MQHSGCCSLTASTEALQALEPWSGCRPSPSLPDTWEQSQCDGAECLPELMAQETGISPSQPRSKAGVKALEAVMPSGK